MLGLSDKKLYKQNLIVLLTGDKNIMWAGLCDLNEYLSISESLTNRKACKK